MTHGNWYTGLETVKAAAGITGSRHDATVADAIESASRQIDDATHTWFIPRIETRNFDARWPTIINNRITFDAWLQSVDTFTDEGDDANSVPSTDYRLLPENDGPPYYAAQILDDQNTTSFRADPNTPQQSFRITGPWGASARLIDGTALSAALAAPAASFNVKDSSKLDVGDTVLIDSEQLWLQARSFIDLAVNTTGALTDALTDETLSLADPEDDLLVGEVILIDAEAMRVTAVASATSVTVERAWNGTTNAAHSSGADIFIGRRFTVDERGVNGTTAAAHDDNASVQKYHAPSDVRQLATAIAVSEFKQGQAGWGREVGRGENAREFTGAAIERLRKRVVRANKRTVVASVSAS